MKKIFIIFVMSFGASLAQAQEFYEGPAAQEGQDARDLFYAWVSTMDELTSKAYLKVLGPKWYQIKNLEGIFTIGAAPSGYLNHGKTKSGGVYSSPLVSGTKCIFWALDADTEAVPIMKVGTPKAEESPCLNALMPVGSSYYVEKTNTTTTSLATSPVNTNNAPGANSNSVADCNCLENNTQEPAPKLEGVVTSEGPFRAVSTTNVSTDSWAKTLDPYMKGGGVKTWTPAQKFWRIGAPILGASFLATGTALAVTQPWGLVGGSNNNIPPPNNGGGTGVIVNPPNGNVTPGVNGGGGSGGGNATPGGG